MHPLSFTSSLNQVNTPAYPAKLILCCQRRTWGIFFFLMSEKYLLSEVNEAMMAYYIIGWKVEFSCFSHESSSYFYYCYVAPLDILICCCSLECLWLFEIIITSQYTYVTVYTITSLPGFLGAATVCLWHVTHANWHKHLKFLCHQVLIQDPVASVE